MKAYVINIDYAVGGPRWAHRIEMNIMATSCKLQCNLIGTLLLPADIARIYSV